MLLGIFCNYLLNYLQFLTENSFLANPTPFLSSSFFFSVSIIYYYFHFSGCFHFHKASLNRYLETGSHKNRLDCNNLHIYQEMHREIIKILYVYLAECRWPTYCIHACEPWLTYTRRRNPSGHAALSASLIWWQTFMTWICLL